MKITALVENTTNMPNIKAKHGLSLYIETEKHKILFDMGSGARLLANAKRLKIDLKKVDLAILSHGHVDHGGALAAFLKINQQAQVYVQEHVFAPHYQKMLGIKIPVGIDPALENSTRIHKLADFCEIDQGIVVFSHIAADNPAPRSNKNLYEMRNGRIVPDDFSHEQYLLLREKEKNYLISGCAHKGIANIMKAADRRSVSGIDYCISGFHLYNPITRKKEPAESLENTAAALSKYSTIFYTCHCTGKYAYRYLKTQLGEQLRYLACGETIAI
ncbi:MAG: MBL fold metallo-hydrolase [Enterococcaceae bacterium]|jgi:7,8-dihydropterin-6-yl-methyl-4-(beta-D-ribofuranosyl)aminobenzene 5'-phosphate synthase|nr:MBL fold metallo-hydrolase [Enterococcaceae bacterium]